MEMNCNGLAGNAHTDQVRHEFSQMFQLKVYTLVEELLSPLITPFIMLYWLRPRTAQFIRFLHENTASLLSRLQIIVQITHPTLGDVCRMAQLDMADVAEQTEAGAMVDESDFRGNSCRRATRAWR